MAESEGPARGPSWSVKERYGAKVPHEAQGDEAPPGTAADLPPPLGARRPWWSWTGIAVVALLLLGTSIGVATVLDGEDDVLRPPCPDDMEEHTPENRCMDPSEACNAFPRGPEVRHADASCFFVSEDGRLALTVRFTGRGTINVALDKPDGTNVFNRGWTGQGNGVAIDETLKGLRGPEGQWRMRVTFSDFQGTAQVIAWG